MQPACFAVATEYGRPIETSSVSQYSPTIIYCIRRGLEKRTRNTNPACLIMPHHGTFLLMVVGIYNLKCTDQVILFPPVCRKNDTEHVAAQLLQGTLSSCINTVLMVCAWEAMTEWVPSTARCSVIPQPGRSFLKVRCMVTLGRLFLVHHKFSRGKSEGLQLKWLPLLYSVLSLCPTLFDHVHVMTCLWLSYFPSNCRWCCQLHQCGCALFLTLTRKFAAFIPAIRVYTHFCLYQLA